MRKPVNEKLNRCCLRMYLYLLYEVDVVNNAVFELSTTSREDEERS